MILNDTQYKSIKAGLYSYCGNFINEYYEPEVEVGNYTSVAGGVTFCGHMNHAIVTHPEVVATYPFTEMCNLDYFEKSVSRGKIVIGSDCWIGYQAFIHDGVTIGDGAIVGALANVTKDVPPFAVVGGNPARILKYRYPSRQIESLLKIKWWEWDHAKICENIQDFKNIDKFIEKYLKLTEVDAI